MLMMKRGSHSQRLRLLAGVALTSAISAAMAYAGSSDVTAATINADLAAKGPRYVLHRYFDDDRAIGYKIVSSGDAAAVKLAVHLLKYSDAGSMESIQSALGEAMIRAPMNVLPYVDSARYLAADQICLPFISEDEPKSYERAVVTRARRSLLSVHRAALLAQKDACLHAIRIGK